MAYGQDQSDVPLPVTPLTSGTTDKPDAPQSSSPDVLPKKPSIKIGTAPHVEGHDPDFPLRDLATKKVGKAESPYKGKEFHGIAAGIGTSEDVDRGKEDESTLPKGVLMQRKLNLMEDSPLYKQGNGNLRLKMQMAFWKQYVEPLGREDQNPVSLKQWLNARTQKWLEQHPNPAINTERMFGYKTEKATALQTSDIEKAQQSIVRGAVGLTKGALDVIPNIPTDLHQKWLNLKGQMGAAPAMLTGLLSPHMGPILIKPDLVELERRHFNPNIPTTNISLDEAYKDEKFVGENYYQNTLYDQMLLKGAFEIVGQQPGILATGGVLGVARVPELLGMTEEAAAVGTKAFPLVERGFFGKAGGFAMDIAKHSVYNGAQGMLLGSVTPGTTAVEEGKKWAEGTLIGMGTGKLLYAPFSPFLSKLWVWGGDEAVGKGIANAYNEYMAKQPHTQVTPVAVAMAGSPAQKMSRAIIEAINQETGGKFWTMPEASRQAILAKLAKVRPDLAREAGLIDQHITRLQAANYLTEQRRFVPELDALLKKFEQMSGEPTAKTIANSVAEKEATEKFRSNPAGAQERPVTKPEPGGMTTGVPTEEKIKITQNVLDNLKQRLKAQEDAHDPAAGATKTSILSTEERLDKLNKELEAKQAPGAASASSLEFGDNFSRHVDKRLSELGIGKDKWEFENRGHKLLFFLNVIASETKLNGPSAERTKEAQLLMNQLMQEFPGRNLKELLVMSDTLWQKMSMLERGGFIVPGKPTRIFRQTHLQPGESPFSHEIDLIQKAAKADALKARAVREEQAKAEAKEAKLKAKVEAAKAKKVEAAKTMQEAAEAPTETKALFVQALKVLGYTPEDIGKMKPEDVLSIIENRIKKGEKTPEVTPEVKEARIKKRTEKGETKAKPAKAEKELTEDEKLAAAFKKSGDAGTGKIDTNILMEVTNRMFPGQKYADLTTAEQSEVNQMAAEISKKGKKTGPGAAHIEDPAFKETERRGAHADFLNRFHADINGTHVRTYNDINMRQVLSVGDEIAVEQLLERYKTDKDFKFVADAARQYVKNNSVMIDIARETIGKKPLHNVGRLGGGVVRMPQVTLLDGTIAKGGGVSEGKWAGTSIMPISHGIKMVEALHDAIRGAEETSKPKWRGMQFLTFREAGIAEDVLSFAHMTDVAKNRQNFEVFNSLKVGDEIDLALSSFSDKEKLAEGFTRLSEEPQGTYENVFLKLEGPHKSVNLKPFNAANEGEHLTSGVFEVTKVEHVPSKKLQYSGGYAPPRLNITIKQKGTF